MTTDATSSTSTIPPLNVSFKGLFDKPDSPIAKICLTNLKKFMDGQISMTELEKENNYCSLEVIHELTFKPEPLRPGSWNDYNFHCKDKGFDKAGFIKDHPDLDEWFILSRAVAWENRDHAEKLECLIKYFSDLGDQVAASKCKEVHRTYPMSLFIGETCIWRRK